MLILKKALSIVTLSASMFLLAPVAHAQASFWGRLQSWWNEMVANWQAGGGGGSGHSVPELDPSAAGGALLLLLLGVAYIASSRRKEEGAS